VSVAGGTLSSIEIASTPPVTFTGGLHLVARHTTIGKIAYAADATRSAPGRSASRSRAVYTLVFVLAGALAGLAAG